jgi:hypothetical protein
VGRTNNIQGNFMEAELERERYSRGQGNEFGYKILLRVLLVDKEELERESNDDRHLRRGEK